MIKLIRPIMLVFISTFVIGPYLVSACTIINNSLLYS
nr:MAG TPA: hypothetical protein [Caudoviricetes sp.]